MEQLRREVAERDAATEEHEAVGGAHGARAEKAAYLRRKLEERAEAERRAAEERG